MPAKTPPQVPARDWSKEDERLYQAILTLENIEKLSLSAIGRAINDHEHLRKKSHYPPKTLVLLTSLRKLSK